MLFVSMLTEIHNVCSRSSYHSGLKLDHYTGRERGTGDGEEARHRLAVAI